MQAVFFWGDKGMKSAKAVSVALLLILLPALLNAQADDAAWDSAYDRWDVAVSLSGGVSYGLRLAAFPSIELIAYNIKIDDYLPLDFGVSVRSLVTRYENPEVAGAGWLQVGVGVSVTAHLSFDDLELHALPFMENFDFYAAVGPAYDFITYAGLYNVTHPPIPSNGIGITTAAGVRYFLFDWLAANVELFNWRFSSGLAVGLTFKL